MIRFGIVGAGNIARKFAQDIRFSTQAKLVAVASRSLQRAEVFQHEFHVEYVFDNYQSMFESDAIDAVYIATPHSHHLEQALDAIIHKKHVLCEKPITVNEEQFQQMIKAARDHNVLVMEAMWTWFLPVYQELSQMIDLGVLGALQSADIRFGYELVSSASKKGRLLNPNLAGGSLLDIGVYPISVVQFFLKDEYSTVKTSALISKTDVDLYVVMDFIVKSPSSPLIHLESSIDRELSNEAIFEFTNGTLVIPAFHQASSFMWNNKHYHFPHKSGGFEYQIDAFCESIQSHSLENSVRTHKDSLRALRWMDDVRQQIGVVYPFENKNT